MQARHRAHTAKQLAHSKQRAAKRSGNGQQGRVVVIPGGGEGSRDVVRRELADFTH